MPSQGLPRVRETNRLTQELSGYLRLKTTTPKEDCSLLHIMTGKRVSLSVWDQNGADEAKSMPCLCPQGARKLDITQDILTDAPDWPAHHCRLMWAPRRGTRSILILCDICWVQGPLLLLWWPCPNLSSCWWKASGLLHLRNRWNSLVQWQEYEQDFWYVTLWRSSSSRFLPLRTSTT